jgi:Flp pilus assembly protein TadG
MYVKHGRGIRSERGQVVVFFALLIPVIFAIGSIVMTAGNWYVLKRHLQTQVDAAALAGGAVANGCNGDATNQALTRDKMKAEALKYSGDTARTGTYNLQPEDTSDVRIVLNSARYWDSGDASDGSGLDWTLGQPCATKYLDVKATDFHVPALVSWIPLFPSVKARARVELQTTTNTNGVRPIGVPEFDPVTVAALFVDEGRASASDPLSISGRGFLPTNIDQATLPPGDPLLGLNAWQGTVDNVNLNNTSDHSVVILVSRSPQAQVNLNYGNGSLQQVCGQDPTQTHCIGGAGLNDGISFVHVYSGLGGAADAPTVHDATLSGGCATDDSRPYYNQDGVDANGNGCTVTLTAHLDFGNAGADPTQPPICAQNFSTGSGGLSYVSGDTWVGNYTFSSPFAGRNLISITGTVRKNPGPAACNSGQTKSITPVTDVAGAYVSTDNSDAVEYLKLDNKTAGLTTTDGNSYPKTAAASIQVTVGFVPPLRDTPITNPPIKLRFGTGPSQTQALDCGTGNGNSAGWRVKMVSGCDAYQVNNRGGSCATPYPTPPDCIDAENGNFNSMGIRDAFASPCTPNNWNGVTYPPDSDPRWIPLFILDEHAFISPGKRTYPIRRFGGFYVTAGDSMGCPGDVPASGVKRTELWGHFVTYFRPGFGDTIPSGQLCTFQGADLCVESLVE